MVVWIALAPVFLPVFLLPMLGVAARVPWMYPGFFFAPLAIVSAPGLFIGFRAVASVVGITATAALIAVAVSPILMIVQFVTYKPSRVEPFAELSRLVTEEWRKRTGRPLAFVYGTDRIAWRIVFHSPDHPRSVPDYERLLALETAAKLWSERGGIGVCRAEERGCHAWLSRVLTGAELTELALQSRLLGFERDRFEYILYIAPEPERGRSRGPEPQALRLLTVPVAADR